MDRLLLTPALVARATDVVLGRQYAIARVVSSLLGYTVGTAEVIDPAVLAAAARLARGLDPAEHIGWIVAEVCRELDPPRRMINEGVLAETYVGEPAERQYLSTRRASSCAGSNHRDPAHRQQAKRFAARAAGQLELSAPGYWMASDEPTEYDRDRDREAEEWDPSSNRPVGMPWGCAVAGGVA